MMMTIDDDDDELVQDRVIVTIERYWEHECCLSNHVVSDDLGWLACTVIDTSQRNSLGNLISVHT